MGKEDSKLIREYLNGDLSSFEILFSKYKKRLFSFLFALTRDENLASDLFQETFVKVIEKISYFKENTNFPAWLFTVARNIFLDHIKNKKNFISIDFKEDDESQSLAETLSSNDNPEYEYIKKIDIKDLLDSLELISYEEKEIIILKHYSQLSFKEIAEELHIPIGTALARFSRGIKKLRIILSRKNNYSEH